MKYENMADEFERVLATYIDEDEPLEALFDPKWREDCRDPLSGPTESRVLVGLLNKQRREERLEHEDRHDHEDKREREEKLDHQIEQQILKKI